MTYKMKRQEAAKKIRDYSRMHRDVKNIPQLETAEKMAVEALEKIQKYEELEYELEKRNMTTEHIREYAKFEDECIQKGFTFDSLLEARERMTAKKPAEKENEYGDIYAVCSNCGEHIINYLNKNVLPPHCMMCGQKIDWRSEE